MFFYPPITYLLTRNPPGPRVNSLSSILVAATDKGICAILFGDDPNTLVRDLQDRFPKTQLIGGDTDFEHVVAKVVGFVDAQALRESRPAPKASRGVVESIPATRQWLAERNLIAIVIARRGESGNPQSLTGDPL